VPARLALDARLRDLHTDAELVASLQKLEGKDPADTCALRYLALRTAKTLEASVHLGAATQGLEACRGQLLQDFAAYRAAEAFVRLGVVPKAEAAVASLSTSPLSGDAAALIGPLREAQGDLDGARASYRAALAASARRSGWEDLHVRLARLELQRPHLTDNEAKALDELLMAVLTESPQSAAAPTAATLRDELVRRKPVVPRPWSPPQIARRLTSLQAAGWDNKKLLAESERTLHTWVTTKDPALQAPRCQVAQTRALASGKAGKAAVADAWGDAIGHCAGEEAEAQALFSGAKASASANRPDEALDRFAQLERKFPKHRFADDARFRSALLVRERGDETRARDMLTSIASAYPDGDMKAEALFRVALAQMASGAWADAKAPLDQIIALTPQDRHWSTGGRAPYFRARCAELTGDVTDAGLRYAKIVRDVPLSFYALQSLRALHARDPKSAQSALQEALALGVGAPQREGQAAQLGDRDAYLRAAALVAVDEVEFARRELFRGRWTHETASPLALEAAARLWNATDHFSIGHAFFRGRVTDYAQHYPTGAFAASWQAGYPRAFANDVLVRADERRVPAAFVWGIMREESSFMPEVRSPTGALGLMQFMPETAKVTAQGTGLAFDETALKTPSTAIALGAKLLSELRTSQGNMAFAAAAYNAGPGAVRRWLSSLPTDFDLWVESIPFEETRGYVKRVLGTTFVYSTVYGLGTLPELLAIPLKTRP
jgi:soluble lytic murein transglycosylase